MKQTLNLCIIFIENPNHTTNTFMYNIYSTQVYYNNPKP